ncbi:MAG: KilA-N domain-containing protein [Bacteroidales bacterium]|nr:KilA-N domain-containing protein [Bacteroidales bacterium]
METIKTKSLSRSLLKGTVVNLGLQLANRNLSKNNLWQTLLVGAAGGFGDYFGGNGTWATDYRIAMRFAQWLSPEFSLKLDDLLVKIVSGELVVSGEGVFIDPKGQSWISCSRFCKALNVSEHSFNGLMSTYKQHFAQIGSFWYVSAELFKLRSVQQYINSRKNEVKKNAPDVTQLSLNF